MQPADAALQLVGLIYDAAADAKLWEPFLEHLAEIYGAQSAAFVMHEKGQEIHTVAASWRIDPEGALLYHQHYGPLDVWATRGHRVRAGYVCTSQEICAPKELSKTEIYNDFLSRFGVEHAMFGLIANNTERWASVSLYRSPSSGEFDERDGPMLRLLVPHIQRAFKLHFQFSELKAKAKRAETTLDMLTTGVVFLGARGEVVLVNRKAEEILGRKDGLRLANNKVMVADGNESARLQGLVKSAIQTGIAKGFGAGGTILISRRKGRALSITVAPLRSFSLMLELKPAAVLLISDPDAKIELPEGLLRREYGLTPAEAGLTLKLMDGRSLKEAAELCGVAQNTAKSHLKSIFSKTQVHRQGELIRLLLTSAGSILLPQQR